MSSSSSNNATHRRRIHNQNGRVPSIEVYTASNQQWSQVECSPTTSGRNNNRLSPQLCPTYLPTEFRILSSTRNLPLGHTNGQARIHNSKSTGNLSVDDKPSQGRRQQPPVVQHASSYGMLSSRTSQTSQTSQTSPGKSQDSHSPSPTSRKQPRSANISPSRNNNTTINSNMHSRNNRLISQHSQFLSIDDSLDADDEEEEFANKSDLTNNHSEPATVLGNTIRPATHETTARRIEIMYSARNDKYKRPSNPTKMRYNGWNSLVYAERNIEWITEHCHDDSGDAVMTYLSRKMGTSNGYIEWRFDFSDIGMKVKKFLLKFPFDTFEDGHIRAYVKADNSEEIPVYSSLISTEVPQMKNWNRFSLIAELSCERESCAFQHAQLFRQTLKSGFFDKQEDKYQFKIEIDLYSMY